MTVIKTIPAVQGVSQALVFTALNPDGSARDLAGCGVAFAMKKNIYDADPALSYVLGVNDELTVDTNIITIAVPVEVTSVLMWSYVYAVLVTNTDGTVDETHSGTVHFRPAVNP